MSAVALDGLSLCFEYFNIASPVMSLFFVISSIYLPLRPLTNQAFIYFTVCSPARPFVCSVISSSSRQVATQRLPSQSNSSNSSNICFHIPSAVALSRCCLVRPSMALWLCCVNVLHAVPVAVARCVVRLVVSVSATLPFSVP